MAFFDSRTFNPQGYGGQGGDLLEMLRSFQQQQQVQPVAANNQQSPLDTAQWPQGPINTPDRYIPVGNYQMPQFGSPDPAQLPANAAPAQGTLPPQAATPEPNRFMTGLQGFLGNLSAGPIGAIAGGVGGLVTGQRTDPVGIAQQQANQTAQALVAKGFEPGLALTVAKNPDLLKAVLPQIMGIGGQTDDIKEYQFAKKEEPGLTFQQFMQRKRAVTGEYSLTPQYGTNEKGETILLQTGKSGEAIQTKLPPGVKVSSGVEKLDGGTSWILIDKRNGNVIGTQPKDIVGKESAEERGKIQGQAQGELPAAQITADRTIKQIDDFEKSAGFNEVFGVLDQFRPNWTMSDAGRKSLTQFKQLEGRAFLEGRALLKGGGAITDFESNKAESAIARLGRSQSEADAKEALQEFKDAVREGVAKLRAKAGGGAAPTAAPTGWQDMGGGVRIRAK